MLSQKLLVDVGFGTFAGENRSHRFFPPLDQHVRFRPSFRSFFILRTRLQLALGAGQIFMKGLPRKAFSDELAASDITL
jgi:hypothetical protein